MSNRFLAFFILIAPLAAWIASFSKNGPLSVAAAVFWFTGFSAGLIWSLWDDAKDGGASPLRK